VGSALIRVAVRGPNECAKIISRSRVASPGHSSVVLGFFALMVMAHIGCSTLLVSIPSQPPGAGVALVGFRHHSWWSSP